MDVAQLVAALREAGVSQVTLQLATAPLGEQPSVAAPTLSAPDAAAVAELHRSSLEKLAKALATDGTDDTWAATGLVPLDAEQLMSETDRDLAAHLAEARHNPQSAVEAQRRAGP